MKMVGSRYSRPGRVRRWFAAHVQAGPPDDRERAEQALLRLGFDWDRLEKLARRCLNHRMATRKITLDEDRYQRALELYVDVGAAWSLEYDVDKAGGQSFATSCYRRMFPRLHDFLRAEHGDSRRGSPIYVQTTATGDVPERETMDEETFDRLIDELRPRLKGWSVAAKAIEIARDVIVNGLPSVAVAARHGIEPSLVGEYLEAFGHQLGYRSAAA